MTEQEQYAERRKRVLKKLAQTRRDETVCLMYWEVAIVLDYIYELRKGCKHGSSEVSTAGSKGEIGSNGRG